MGPWPFNKFPVHFKRGYWVADTLSAWSAGEAKREQPAGQSTTRHCYVAARTFLGSDNYMEALNNSEARSNPGSRGVAESAEKEDSLPFRVHQCLQQFKKKCSRFPLVAASVSEW